MRYLVIFMMLFSAAAIPALSQPGPGKHMNWKKDLKLTDDQAKTLKDLRMKTAKEMVDINASIKKKQIDMRSMMSEDSPDRGKVEKTMKELADLNVQRRMAMFDTRQAMFKVLTPEQRDKFKELMKDRMGDLMKGGKNMRMQRMQRMQKMRQMHGGMMGGGMMGGGMMGGPPDDGPGNGPMNAPME